MIDKTFERLLAENLHKIVKSAEDIVRISKLILPDLDED